MLSVNRNKDYFDQQYFATDMASLKEFMQQANSFDNRQALLEEWIVRKEQEFKQRVMLPPKALQQSDFKLN